MILDIDTYFKFEIRTAGCWDTWGFSAGDTIIFQKYLGLKFYLDFKVNIPRQLFCYFTKLVTYD
jgi:hypothetical protein